MQPINDANRSGLDYRTEANALGKPTCGGIWDVHTHLRDLEAAKLYFEAADCFGIERAWSMTNLEQMGPIEEVYGDRIRFIAVPNYDKRDEPDTFTTDWLTRIERFRGRGVTMVKFWAAPRGRDMHPALRLDSPQRDEAMKLALSLGYQTFMTHVADPDTWFATMYADAEKYGLKAEHYEPLERLLDRYCDVPWIAAHMGGHPEDLEHLQHLLDRHPNLHLDTSAAKWMVRELSKRPDELRDFCERNVGRVLFGTDIVADSRDERLSFDLMASRFWVMRTLLETTYVGPSPIVDPDLHMVDPTASEKATAHLRGAGVAGDALEAIQRGAAMRLFGMRG